MQDKKNSSFKNIADAIASFDIYASHAQFYFQGRRKVSSMLGILTTWIVVALIISFSIYKVRILFKKSSYKTQMASILNNVNYTQPEIIQMNEYGFDFAVGFTGSLISEIGELQIQKVTRETEIIDGEYQASITSEEIEMEPCTVNNFNHTDKEEIKTKGLTKDFLCIKNKSDLGFGGTWGSTLYKYIEISLVACTNSSDSPIICKSKDEIDAFFKEYYINILPINYFFDKDDIEQVIKGYIDDSFYFTLLPDQKLYSDMFFKLSEASLSLSLNPLTSPQHIKFPQIDRVSNHITSEGFLSKKALLRVAIRLDYWANLYSKEIYSFTDFASEVGGMFNSIFGLGRILFILFADVFLHQKLISELYFYFNNKSKKFQETKKEFNYLEVFHNYQQKQPIKVTCFDIFKSYICCYCLKRSTVVKTQHERKMKLFFKGRSKIMKEFDVLHLFKLIREVKLMKRILFTKEERHLMSFSRMNILESDEEKHKNDPIVIQERKLKLNENLQKLLKKKKQSQKLEQIIHLISLKREGRNLEIQEQHEDIERKQDSYRQPNQNSLQFFQNFQQSWELNPSERQINTKFDKVKKFTKAKKGQFIQS